MTTWLEGVCIRSTSGTIFVVSVPLRLMIAETAAWQAFAEFLIR